MNVDFITALDELENDKGIKKAVILDAIENALISAYKRNFGITQNARVTINDETGEIIVYAEKNVVDDVFDDTFEVSLEDARKINPAYEVGDTLEVIVTPESFGRIAAQTAKQVVVQRLREAERGVIFDQYIDREGEIMTATIQRQERGAYFVDLGRAEGILPLGETIPGERYEQGMRLKVYVLEVRKTAKGPQIVTSRSHPGLVKRLFEMEVPEISQNSVVIKSIAREAGQRTKISVYAEDENIDPVGACVGTRGSRIDRIVAELGNERIDVIPWSPAIAEYIANALRPAKVIMCQVHTEEKAAKVIVPDYQLSLAIGKEGQNARLAAKLTGFKIDIKSQSQIVNNVFGDSEEAEFEGTVGAEALYGGRSDDESDFEMADPYDVGYIPDEDEKKD